jgi:hypothetical protein
MPNCHGWHAFRFVPTVADLMTEQLDWYRPLRAEAMCRYESGGDAGEWASAVLHNVVNLVATALGAATSEPGFLDSLQTTMHLFSGP